MTKCIRIGCDGFIKNNSRGSWCSVCGDVYGKITTRRQLAAHFGEKKAKAICNAVGEMAAEQIAYALDFEAADKRIENWKQRVIQIGKERANS